MAPAALQLSRRNPRDRHPERRARHVVEAYLEERDRVRVAAVLATDPSSIPGWLPTLLAADPDDLATPGSTVSNGLRARICGQVLGQELRLDVVAREAECRLRQVVGPEAEESATLPISSAVTRHAATRSSCRSGCRASRRAAGPRPSRHSVSREAPQLGHDRDERNHDLGLRVQTALLQSPWPRAMARTCIA